MVFSLNSFMYQYSYIALYLSIFFIGVYVLGTLLDKLYCLTLPTTKFGFKGKLAYIDDGTAKVLISHKYKLKAKPDYIFRTSLFTYTLVEFKSRYKGCYDSDVKQIYASTICARAMKYNVQKALLVTSGHQYPVKVSMSNAGLFRRIRREVKIISAIRNGCVPKVKRGDNCLKCTRAEKCRVQS